METVRRELQPLRQGQGLAHPGVVLRLSPTLRAHLTSENYAIGPAAVALAIVATLRGVIDQLGRHERVYVEVDMNISSDHHYETLTERQESLARALGCTAKTVRRRSDKALDSLALLVAGKKHRSFAPSKYSSTGDRHPVSPADSSWRERLRSFWGLTTSSLVDIVCSEIPKEERPPFASTSDRNYLRYAKFADLDSLIYTRGRIMRIEPDARIRDFAPSEYFDSNAANTLIVIGGPPWNAKYREFMTQLPFYFEPNPLGQDDPLVVPIADHPTLGPRWTAHNELLEDLAVFTRLTLAADSKAYLLGGCLTLGVLGAAKCFLDERGARNAEYITDLVGDDDFVAVVEARRLGGFSDVAEFSGVPPLLLLSRHRNEPFKVVLDHSGRYVVT